MWPQNHGILYPFRFQFWILFPAFSKFLAGEDAGRVDEGEPFEHRRLHGHTLQPLQKVVAEIRQLRERLGLVDNERVPGNYPIRLALSDA